MQREGGSTTAGCCWFLEKRKKRGSKREGEIKPLIMMVGSPAAMERQWVADDYHGEE